MMHFRGWALYLNTVRAPPCKIGHVRDFYPSSVLDVARNFPVIVFSAFGVRFRPLKLRLSRAHCNHCQAGQTYKWTDCVQKIGMHNAQRKVPLSAFFSYSNCEICGLIWPPSSGNLSANPASTPRLILLGSFFFERPVTRPGVRCLNL